MLESALKLQANTLETVVYLNTGKGSFTKIPLPVEAQFSPVYAISINDFDGDNQLDILLGGNLYQSKPEVGRYDASYGLYLKGNGKGNFKSVSSKDSGFKLKGQARGFSMVTVNNKPVLMVEAFIGSTKEEIEDYYNVLKSFDYEIFDVSPLDNKTDSTGPLSLEEFEYYTHKVVDNGNFFCFHKDEVSKYDLPKIVPGKTQRSVSQFWILEKYSNFF